MILFFLIFLKQSAISQMEKDLKQRAQEVQDRDKEVEYFTPNSFWRKENWSLITNRSYVHVRRHFA